jgi:HAE1 family hydrophobic/amphiphilic exporter-1
MTFSEFFIRRPIATLLMVLVLSVFGVWSYFQLPVNSLPTVDYPVIQVSVSYPGASPATMASAVATPLENEFTQIGGLQSMISDNKEGRTTINLTFSLNRDVDLVAPDVQAAITRAQSNLPKDLPNPPAYLKFNPSDSPIYYVMAHSEFLTHADLYDYINQILAKKLSMVEGVSKVNIYGSKRAVRIRFDPAKMAVLHIGFDELTQALRAGTVNIPGGSLNGEARTFSLEPHGQLRSAREFGELIITVRQGAPIRLREIADCVDSITTDVTDIRYSKVGITPRDKCVVMAISRISGANTVAVADRISRGIEEARLTLPPSIALETMFNSSGPIRESLLDVQVTVLIALLLVVGVIFLFLGRIRETLIPSVVLPVSLLGTLVLMKIAGFSLDTLSLMGIVLSVGFLVDDSIVVLENTVRHLDAGLKPIPAALTSMREITFTIVSTSAIMVIVFIPLVFMQGAVGRNLREFALTVIFAMVVSTLLAQTLSPMMCARTLKHDRTPNPFERWIARIMGAIIRHYGIALHWQLRHKGIALLSWFLCLGGSVALFLILPKSFLPKGDSGFIRGALVMPQGASTEQMRAFQSRAMALMTEDPDVVQVGSVTGMQPGADQSMGFMFIRLRPPHERKLPIDAYVQKFTGRLMSLPDGFAFLQASPVLKISSGADSTAAGSDYAFMLTGLNREAVYAAARQLETEMRGLPGFFGVQSNIKLNMPRLTITLDRDRASTLGITAQTIEQALATAYAGGYVTQFTTDQDQYQVILEAAQESRRLPDDLAQLYLRSPVTGALIPLSSLATWTEDAGPQNVPHAQQQESATLSFSLTPDIALGDATRALETLTARILPLGVSGSFTGDALEFQKSIASLGILLLVAIFLKYIVLGILYESWIHPLTILTSLPVAAVGGLLTLLAFHCELSLYAYIGLFVLIGLISKNGILMVDFALQRKREGKNSYDAVHDACVVRFRPILMTGLCTILGTLPIAVGYGADGSSRIPLGLMVVGGMIFAQVITLFLTPALFLYLESVQNRLFKTRTDLE